MSDRMNPSVYVALDINDLEVLKDTMASLLKANRQFGVKLGLEALTAFGLQTLERYIPSVVPVFVDGKFKDIPNTVAGAAKALRKYQPAIFNVHASGGVEMMKAAVAERGDSDVFAVTVLTSLDDQKQECQYSYGAPVKNAVARFAGMASEAGVQGLICSAQDLTSLKGCGVDELLKLTPGIRPKWAAAKGDQKRVTTPAEAVLLGADGIVVGRPILKPPTGMAISQALRRVNDEMCLIRLFQKYDGLLTGHFVLKSGRHSDRYLNKDVLFPHEPAMSDVSAMMADLIWEKWKPDLIVGPETGGAKLAKAVGIYMGVAFNPAHKTEGGFRLDCEVAGRRVVITEDILTTGGSVASVAKAVETADGEVLGIVGLVNRGNVVMDGLETIASLDVESWAAEECPLCKQSVPINTNVGYGKGNSPADLVHRG